LDDFPSSTTFLNANKIYNMRSKIVHGSGRYDDPYGGYLEQTKSYAGRSCICFLILCRNRIGLIRKNKEAKRDVLIEIDEAMLDLQKRELLEKEIIKGIRDDFTPKIKQQGNYFGSRRRILGIKFLTETPEPKSSGTNWFPEPVMSRQGGILTVHFSAAEGEIAANQLEYTVDGGTNWETYGGGSAITKTSLGTVYQKLTFPVREGSRFNVRHKTTTTGGAVTLTFCQLYRCSREEN
jgi:hypothetical protein